MLLALYIIFTFLNRFLSLLFKIITIITALKKQQAEYIVRAHNGGKSSSWGGKSISRGSKSVKKGKKILPFILIQKKKKKVYFK